MVPPEPRVSSKTTVYSPMVAPAEAESVSVMVQVFDEPEVAGTVGVNVMLMLCDVPRLSKYSTDRFSGSPLDPNSVSVAGRFTPSSIRVVGSDVNWFTLICTGSSPSPVSRGKVGIEPSGAAGQPISVTPDDVRRNPSSSVRNDPVVAR